MREAFVLAILAAAPVPRLAAEDLDLPARVQEPEREKKALTAVERAELEAKRLMGLEAPDVAYEQVMEHPDDVELNYRYALSQVRRGNLRSASATLERITMVNPDLPKVRLVHAIVLYRLDNLDDAERELETLRPQKMPQSLRSELEEYLRAIRRRRRQTHWSVVLGAGLEYDDNRNAAPATGQRLFFDTPITLDSASTRKSDVAKTMLGSAGVRHDLGYQAGHELFADYSYYRAEQTNLRFLNLQNHFADAGFVYKAKWAEITPSFEFDHLLLTQTTYMRSRAVRLHVERKAAPRLAVYVEAAHTHQTYNRTLIVTNGDNRTGDKAEGTGGMNFVLTPTMNLLGSYTFISQGAAAKFDAYNRHSFNLGHTWLLGRGRFLLSSAVVNLDRYETPEPAVSQTNRRDTTYRLRGTLGVPLSFVSPSLLSTFSYEYYQALSTLRNYAYSDNKVSLFLTYKWDL